MLNSAGDQPADLFGTLFTPIQRERFTLKAACIVLAFLFSLTGTIVSAEDSNHTSEDRTDMNELIENITADEFSQISELMRELAKIDRRDLFIPVARLQLHYLLRLIESSDLSEDHLAETKKFTRGVAYNIASFTWPGWDDTPNITPEMIERGAAAAKVGLRLAEELDDIQPGILWINGAHALAAKRYDQAQTYFQRATERARNDFYADMNRLWIKLAEYLGQPNSENQSNFDAALSTFQTNWQSEQDVSFFADQLITALRVFQPSIAD